MPRERDGRCGYVKPDGSRCKAPAVGGRKLCCFHDPGSARRTAEGRKRGGVNRNKPAATLPADAPDLPLASVADVTAALAEAYNGVRTGRLAVGVGNCLAVLGQALMRAIEAGDLERRVAALEGKAGPQLRRTA